ncbi:Cyclin [Rhizoctonia solani]|uniref:Cyclin n=1 Tax=Rhizoctonia solani TaxID=456999 RepID=A0A8H7M324_9AGAM|nr:Cyclin [Rhizoctonia solani]
MVVDLTLGEILSLAKNPGSANTISDTGAWPTRLNHEFYSIVKDALDRTRNLRRLALLLDSDIVRVSPRTRRSDLSQVYGQTLGYDVSTILENCRFRLHHFVYEGPDSLSCLETFLDFQSMIRTLQIPYRPAVMRSSFALPPHVTQLWLPLSGHANGFHYNNIGKISHLSIKGEPLPSSLEQFRDSPIHYLAHDLSSWTATRLMLPGWLQRLVPEMFSNLQVLRLIDYWVTCETADNATSFPQPNSTSAVTELADWDTITAFPLGNPINPPLPTENEVSPLGIGHFLHGTADSDSNTAPILRVESGLLDMLSHLPHLKALEVGGFVVRDIGQLRNKVGHAELWLSQRTQWEEDFVNSIAARSATNLVVVSFLACDKPLYLSAFRDAPLTSPDSHRQWCAYLQSARAQVSEKTEESGATISSLVAQAGLQQWKGSDSEPSQCDYEIDSSFMSSKLTRDLAEEVVMSEWIKVGSAEGWKRRTNSWSSAVFFSPPPSSLRLPLLITLSRSFLSFQAHTCSIYPLDRTSHREPSIQHAAPYNYHSTRTHPSSLVPASEHHSDLLWLMNQRVNADMVDHIVAKVCDVVPHCCDNCHPPTLYKRTDSPSTLPSPPVTPTKPAFQNDSLRRAPTPLPALGDFLGNIISSSKIQAPTLLCTLVYLERIRPKLPPIDKSSPHSRSPDVQHRVLMATIICAAKYLNDSSPKNKHWALYSWLAHALLDWDLRLTEEECISAFSVFFGKCGPCATNHPTTPPKDIATRAGPSHTAFEASSSFHLSVPSNRRASRPAKIEIAAGPAHLHPSFRRSDTIREEMVASDQTSQSNGEENVNKVECMRTQGTRRTTAIHEGAVNDQSHTSNSHPNVRFAANLITLSGDCTIGNNQESVSSWPTLSRANGILERVWGNNHHGRSGFRSSRSVGGLFRAATSESLAEQDHTGLIKISVLGIVFERLICIEAKYPFILTLVALYFPPSGMLL